MCRNIRNLFNFDPPATDAEIRDAALQFVRKVSGSTRPSRRNEPAFNRAVETIAAAAHELLGSMETNQPPRDREAEAVKAGVRREAIAAVRDHRAPAGLTEDEALVVAYVVQLLQHHRVDDATFAAMRDRFGVEGVVELTATVGYYGMLACVLNAFDVAPEAGADVLPA